MPKPSELGSGNWIVLESPPDCVSGPGGEVPKPRELGSDHCIVLESHQEGGD